MKNIKRQFLWETSIQSTVFFLSSLEVVQIRYLNKANMAAVKTVILFKEDIKINM